MHEDNEDCTSPYLTTIGWDGQPKEWFLYVRLWDFDFARLITLTPLDCPGALDALRDTSLAMMRDIQRSDAKQPKKLIMSCLGSECQTDRRALLTHVCELSTIRNQQSVINYQL